jgi:hypothetical protein
MSIVEKAIHEGGYTAQLRIYKHSFYFNCIMYGGESYIYAFLVRPGRHQCISNTVGS